MHIVAAVALSLLASQHGVADEWFAPTRLEVRTSTGGRETTAVTMVQGPNGDAHIITDQGEMYLVRGRILLTKGVEMTPGAEIDALDVPVLEAQLALKLLALAIPEGPSSLRGERTVNITESNEAIELATPSAGGSIPPLWSLRGTVKRSDASRISFALTFLIKPPKMISGSWERSTPEPAFSDMLSVAGWRAFELGPHKKAAANGTILDYSAEELPRKFKTFGEARAAAKKTKE